MRTALIDADILKYLAGFACQKEIWTHKPTGEWFEGKDAANTWFKESMGAPKAGILKWMQEHWVPEDWEMELELKEWWSCKQILDDKINLCKETNNCERVRLFFTPHKVFRHDIAVTRGYKENRKDLVKPVYADKIFEYLTLTYPCEIGENIEADDLLGINQTAHTVICSNDKDLMMIPGAHFNFALKEEDERDPHEWQDLIGADQCFFTQLIAGDSTDNIQGVPSIGVKKARDIVDMFGDDLDGLVEHIEGLYEAHYPNHKEVMEEHAALVWILRSGETIETAGWRTLLGVEAK